MSFYREQAQLPDCDYNKFFHPNVCHVCKTHEKTLKSCPDCRMISYCNEEHRRKHLMEHREMCRAAQTLNATRNLRASRGMTSHEWLVFRRENVRAVKLVLHRELKPYEEQMFLFARSCHVCYQQHNLRIACHACFSVNICDDHKSIGAVHDCIQLTKSLWLDTDDLITKIDAKISQRHLPDTMTDIVKYGRTELIVQRFRHRETGKLIWQADDYRYSDSMSGPLTLCYTMQYIHFPYYFQIQEAFVVHVITGSSTDTHSLSAWEVVLHALYAGTILKVVMIGPELKSVDVGTWDVCKMCHASNKKLRFEIHGLLYEQYVQRSFYLCPDVIVGFQAELRKLGANAIRVLQHGKCPLLLTSESAEKALHNSRKIKEVLGPCPIPCLEGKNWFHSHRPYRDFEGNTYLPNSYLTAYAKLYFSSDPIFNSTCHV